jgi:hypothetical protein
MNKYIYTLGHIALFAWLAFAFTFGCSSSPIPRNVPVTEKKDVGTVEAKYAASELGAQQVAELRFPRGSAKLKLKELKRLDAALSKARKEGKVDEIKVIAWADREYPSYNSGSLPKPDQELARERNEAIQKILTGKVSGAGINTYNMAVYPNGAERLFKTSDFRVKRSLEQAGIPNADTGVKMPAMAGKALVMILLEKRPEPATN